MPAVERKLSVVSDFDGVVTDAWKEAETYVTAYTETLAGKIGIPHQELVNHLKEAKEKVLSSPGVFGWEHNGLIVGPAEADPYLLNQAAVRIVLDRLRQNSKKLTIPQVGEMGNFFNGLHHEVYPKAGIFFRDGAREYLEEINARQNLTVVTNSKTEGVKRKLEVLLGEGVGKINVIGDARKYEVDQTWIQFPEYTKLPGLPRKIYLRRKTYYDTLQRIGAEVVIGDIYELDLALPETMGKQTILVLSTHTPEWEAGRYNHHPYGFKTSSLSSVTNKVNNLT